MADRKIIFECRTGSHLYGTNTPASDEDFKGVFLPSADDLLGMQACPGEMSQNVKLSTSARNQAGDVDRKYFSIKKFFDLACQGQPQQLEMLFAPTSTWVSCLLDWNDVLVNRHLFLSKNGIKPFLGFATSQAHKAVVKGENLQLIRDLIAFIKPSVSEDSRVVVSELMKDFDVYGKTARFGSIVVKYFINGHGYDQIEVAGRNWDPGILAKTFLKSLELMESRYGTRTDAAAKQGYDFKSLSHAVRLISEAEEFLLKGVITMPRPDAEFILQVKRGEVKRDWFDYLFAEIDRLEQEVLPKSPLPEQPNRTRVNELCIEMLQEHLRS